MKLSYIDLLGDKARHTVSATVTTEHPSVRYHQPVILLDDGDPLDATSWALLGYQVEEATPEEMKAVNNIYSMLGLQLADRQDVVRAVYSRMGQVKSERKVVSSMENGKLGGRPRKENHSFDDLQDLTGHEAGAVVYADGSVWVGNWTMIIGVPQVRDFLKVSEAHEQLSASRIAVPDTAKKAMQEHERKQGDKVSRSGFVAWLISDTTYVVIQKNWN